MNRIPDEPQVCDFLFWNKVTFLPVKAPAQNHEEKSRYLSMEEGLGWRGALDEDIIHVDGNQNSPCSSEKSHHRSEDLGKDPRATL